MKITSLFSVFITLIVSTGLSVFGPTSQTVINASAQNTNSSLAQMATFFECKSGYKFQVSGKSARCFKPAITNYSAPSICKTVTIAAINITIEHILNLDYESKKDKCVGIFKIGLISNINTMELVCRRSYHLEVRRGKDRCRKVIPAKTVAPVTRVQR